VQHTFLEALEQSKIETVQAGFDVGYEAGANLGFLLGQLRGLLR
jgi:hypothetical protein